MTEATHPPDTGPSRARRVGLGLTAVVVAIVIGGCSGQASLQAPDLTHPSATTPADRDADLVSRRVAQADQRTRQLKIVVDELASATYYEFVTTLTLNTGSGQRTLELQGWVSGNDRELIFDNGTTKVITRVQNYIATVERDGQVSEVPLSSAESAPSLGLLTAATDLTEIPVGDLEGRLSLAALEEHGYELASSDADLTITLLGDTLRGYQITSDDGDWTVTTRFDNILT